MEKAEKISVITINRVSRLIIIIIIMRNKESCNVEKAEKTFVITINRVSRFIEGNEETG
jgi:hypothetical protein